jgi:hypothetical protein
MGTTIARDKLLVLITHAGSSGVWRNAQASLLVVNVPQVRFLLAPNPTFAIRRRFLSSSLVFFAGCSVARLHEVSRVPNLRRPVLGLQQATKPIVAHLVGNRLLAVPDANAWEMN